MHTFDREIQNITNKKGKFNIYRLNIYLLKVSDLTTKQFCVE